MVTSTGRWAWHQCPEHKRACSAQALSRAELHNGVETSAFACSPNSCPGQLPALSSTKNTPAMHLSDLKTKTHCVRAGQCCITFPGIIKD